MEDYESAWDQLQKLSPRLLTYENRAMYSTWNVSYASIQRISMSAAMLLRLWAFFANEDLWFELLRESRDNGRMWLQDLTANRLAFDEGMRVLCNHGLVEAHSILSLYGAESNGYSVHGCVHSWMVFVLNDQTESSLATLAMECTSRHVPGQDIPEYWAIQRRLLPHANRCQQILSMSENGGSYTSVPASLGLLYADQGRLKDAEAMYRRALDGYEKALGSHQLTTYIPALNTLENFGMLCMSVGRREEALLYLCKARDGVEGVWGPNCQRCERISIKIAECTHV